MLTPTRMKSAKTSVDAVCRRATSATMRDRIVPVGLAWKNRSDWYEIASCSSARMSRMTDVPVFMT